MYEIGAESGRHYSVNVPLKEGIDDQSKYVCMYIRDKIVLHVLKVISSLKLSIIYMMY